MSISLNNVPVTKLQPVRKPEAKSEAKSSINTGIKVAIGTGLAALAAVGIYMVTKGRAGNKEMGLEAFKKAGNKFIKGRAVTKSGKGFTGNIAHKTKDGKTILMEYKDGNITKSTSSSGVVKEYIYAGNKLRQVLITSGDKISKLGVYSNEIQRILPDGSSTTITKLGNGAFTIKKVNKSGSPVEHEFNKYVNGKLVTRNVSIKGADNKSSYITTLYHPDGKTPKLELDERLSVNVYNQKGEKVAQVRSVLTDEKTYVPYSFKYNDVAYRKECGALSIETPIGTLNKDRKGVECLTFQNYKVNRSVDGVSIEKDCLPIKDSRQQASILAEADKYRQQILEQGNSTYEQVSGMLSPDDLKQLFNASNIY